MSLCTLDDFLKAIERLAPPEGAAEWDNTGLLLEGTAEHMTSVLLTLDLTPAVAAEAIRTSSQAVISYHPPIFGGLDKLTEADPMQAGLLSLIRNGIHVYSPHTALDAAPGGVSDWLAGCFAAKEVVAHEGSARIVTLRTPLSLNNLSQAWNHYLRSPYLRMAKPAGRARKIRTLALCPGAGASALDGLQVDAVLTGEMKHHDVLSWQRKGTAVILAEHGHTERPYLPIFRNHLRDLLPNVEFLISKKDKEPLHLVLPDA